MDGWFSFKELGRKNIIGKCKGKSYLRYIRICGYCTQEEKEKKYLEKNKRSRSKQGDKKKERVRKEGLESNEMTSGVMVKNFFLYFIDKDRFEIKIREK